MPESLPISVEIAQLRAACAHVVDAWDEIDRAIQSKLLDSEICNAAVACALILNGVAAYDLSDDE